MSAQASSSHETRPWDGAARVRDGFRCIGGLLHAETGRLHGICHAHYPGPDCPYCERLAADETRSANGKT